MSNYNNSLNNVILSDTIDNIIVGNIQNAIFFDDYVYLIDNLNNNILHISNIGELINTINKSGKGPGEYIKPVKIDSINNNIILLDQALNRISIFSPDSFIVNNSVLLDINMHDMCVNNANIWVYGTDGDYLFHNLSSNLSVINSYDGDYDLRNGLIHEISGSGKIACDEQFIYLGFGTDNKIRIYNAENGNLKTEVIFDEIIPIEIKMAEVNGNIGFSRKYYQGEAINEYGNFHDNLINLVKVKNNLIAQYKRTYSDHDVDSIVSIIYSMKNKTYSTVIDGLPYIYDFKNNTLLTGSNNPLPILYINNLQ